MTQKEKIIAAIGQYAADAYMMGADPLRNPIALKKKASFKRLLKLLDESSIYEARDSQFGG